MCGKCLGFYSLSSSKPVQYRDFGNMGMVLLLLSLNDFLGGGSGSGGLNGHQIGCGRQYQTVFV